MMSRSNDSTLILKKYFPNLSQVNTLIYVKAFYFLLVKLHASFFFL